MRAVGLFRGGTKKKKRRIHTESLNSQRDINVRDMISNNIKVTRKPVLSFLGGTSLALSKKLTRPFKSPCLHLRTDESDALLKTKKLGMTAFRPHKTQAATNRRYGKKITVKNDDVKLIDPSKRLIVYERDDLVVEVPHVLANVLREHQREGVRFLFACAAGVSIPPFSGAILADDMGLEYDDDDIFMNDIKQSKKKEVKNMTVADKNFNTVPKSNNATNARFTDKKKGENDNHINTQTNASITTAQSTTTSINCAENQKQPEQKKVLVKTRQLFVKHAIVVCPTSLVANWINEFKKWLKDRLQCIAVDGSSQKEKIKQIRRFTNDRQNKVHVLVISYETFRIYVKEFQGNGVCDLLICDEAHRLKNDQTRINQALNSLSCDRRILLSGTPLQNDLDEFWVMSSFCMLRRIILPNHVKQLNSNGLQIRPLQYNNKVYTDETIFGNQSKFRKHFANPLLAAREPDATQSEIDIGHNRQIELAELTSKFVLRRTNELNKLHLPDKLTMVVNCPLSPLQQLLYQHLTRPSNLDRSSENNKYSILSAITSLKKLVNHPILLYRMIQEQERKIITSNKRGCGDFFTNLKSIFPESFHDPRQRRECERAHYSGKMQLLYSMMQELSQNTNERIVLVSNYTETLDLFERLCRSLNTRYLRLDGGVSIKKRQTIVNRFNDANQNYFAFLLSSKAGGCGLNLIGGSRLVLFDPAWNPSHDLQAAARIWRDGQKKKCYIYRFLACGTIEEKIFQRQIMKQGLEQLVMNNEEDDDESQINGGTKHGKRKQSAMSTEEVRKLFELKKTESDTHDILRCEGCHAKKKMWKLHPRSAGFKPEDKNAEETDLRTWAHHANVGTVDDKLLISCCNKFQAATANRNTMTSTTNHTNQRKLISFTFSYAVNNG
eukprot:g8283.t1